METLPARTIDRDLSIAEMHMSGMAQRDIAKEVGISQARVSQILHTDDSIKTIVDATTRKLTLLSPKVYKNYNELSDSKDDSIKLAATDRLSKIIGYTPSNASNTLIVNILNATAPAADSEALEILRKAMQPGSQTIIDVTPEDL